VIGFAIAGWDVPGGPPLSLGCISLSAAAIIVPFTILLAPVDDMRIPGDVTWVSWRMDESPSTVTNWNPSDRERMQLWPSVTRQNHESRSS
jgi:hypothetical protein